MTKATDEDVIAYVDGRLAGAVRDDFEARIERDPALAQQIAAHRWMTRQIVAAFGVPPGDDIDQEELARLGLSTNNVVDLGRHPARKLRRSLIGAIVGGAMAASLAAGVLLDRTVARPETGLLRTGPAGEVFAQGKLADSLSARSSGEPGAIRIGLSFRTAHTVCRTFSTDRGLSGLGCREGSRWAVPMVVASHEAPGGYSEYHLAGGNVAQQVMAEVDSRMVGDPLAPDQEKALIASDWKVGQ